jgi:hypothetical protein
MVIRWALRTAPGARARLFVVSYAALGFIFAARFGAQGHWQLTAGFTILGAWGFIDGWRLIQGSGRRSRRITTAQEVSDQGGAVSGYLATYLLPFLGNLPQNAGDWIAYALYFLVALTVYIRSDLALVNPTLYLLGFGVFRAQVDGRPSLVVSSAELRSGMKIEVSGPRDVLVVQRVCDTDQP